MDSITLQKTLQGSLETQLIWLSSIEDGSNDLLTKSIRKEIQKTSYLITNKRSEIERLGNAVKTLEDYNFANSNKLESADSMRSLLQKYAQQAYPYEGDLRRRTIVLSEFDSANKLTAAFKEIYFTRAAKPFIDPLGQPDDSYIETDYRSKFNQYMKDRNARMQTYGIQEI